MTVMLWRFICVKFHSYHFSVINVICYPDSVTMYISLSSIISANQRLTSQKCDAKEACSGLSITFGFLHCECRLISLYSAGVTEFSIVSIFSTSEEAQHLQAGCISHLFSHRVVSICSQILGLVIGNRKMYSTFHTGAARCLAHTVISIVVWTHTATL